MARRLGRRLSGNEAIQVVEAGSMPENYSGLLRKSRPDFVLLVDAIRGGTAPGRIRWIEWDELQGISAFTHGTPLNLLAGYLREQLNCSVGLIGIEGAGFDFGAPVSPPVRRAVSRIVKTLSEILTRPSAPFPYEV